MPDFDLGGGVDTTPFGRNEFLRSTRNILTESYTFAKGGLPARTIDGDSTQKVLQPGTLLAKITSGPDTGKVGVYQAGATDGRQTAANVVGICMTFLPWQLRERDVEVSVVYGASVFQPWVLEYVAAATAPTPIAQGTVDAVKALPYFNALIFSK